MHQLLVPETGQCDICLTVSVEGKICTVKKRSNLLPALINEYNIPIIISYSISGKYAVQVDKFTTVLNER